MRTIGLSDAVAIIQAVYAAKNYRPDGSTTREQRNAWFAEAVGHVHWGGTVFNPGEGDSRWVCKSAGGGRPQSDDMLARQVTPTELRGWDLILGSGAPGARWADVSGPGEDISTQEPIIPPKPAPSSAPVVTGPAWEPKHAEELAKLTIKLGLSGPNRAHAEMIADHFAFKWPDELWSSKRAGIGRPVSDNVIARFVDGALWGFTVLPPMAAGPIGKLGPEQLAGIVTPFDYLEESSPEPIVGGDPGDETDTLDDIDLQPMLEILSQIQDALDALEKKVDEIATAASAIERKIPAQVPTYQARLFGQTVEFTPKGE